MPFFSNKFSPKKTPIRKASIFLANKNLSPERIEKELGPEVGPIRLCLGDQEATFDAGLWIPGELHSPSKKTCLLSLFIYNVKVICIF